MISCVNMDFGCDFCIPKKIVATPAQSEDLVNDTLVEQIDCIAATGIVHRIY